MIIERALAYSRSGRETVMKAALRVITSGYFVEFAEHCAFLGFVNHSPTYNEDATRYKYTHFSTGGWGIVTDLVTLRRRRPVFTFAFLSETLQPRPS